MTAGWSDTRAELSLLVLTPNNRALMAASNLPIFLADPAVCERLAS